MAGNMPIFVVGKEYKPSKQGCYETEIIVSRSGIDGWLGSLC